MNTLMPSPTLSNPFAAGVKYGLIGATTGVGVSGIYNAMQQNAGYNVPFKVMKPMLLGAAFGALLGYASDRLRGIKRTVSPGQRSYYDLLSDMYQDKYGTPLYSRNRTFKFGSTPYAGLKLIPVQRGHN